MTLAYPIDVGTSTPTTSEGSWTLSPQRGAAAITGGRGGHDKDGYRIYSVWNPETGKAIKLRAHRVA